MVNMEHDALSHKRSSKLLNSESSRSRVEEQPNTFWTQCPFCCAKFRYHMEFLNRLLRCQICRNLFEAHEWRDGLRDQFPNHQEPTQLNTFWTQCPFCCAMSEYRRDILDRLVNCQICRQAFGAHEMKKGDQSLRNKFSDTLKSASSPVKPCNFIDLSAETLNYYDSDEEVRVLRFKPSNISFGKSKRIKTSNEGSCSTSKAPSFVCEICVETKPAHESFGIKNCSHVYCTDCVVKYVDSKLQENITSIGCLVPDCKGSLDPEYCHSILKPEVFEKWGTRLCEDVIIGSQKFYCPCSAMLIDDGTEVVRESECPNCKRLFCAQCKVPWHAGITCAEVKRLNKDDTEKDDLIMEKLAYKKHWRKCPTCGIYVERSGGCTTIPCRCGTYFDFHCGRLGCPFCGKRRKNTMGYCVFMKEYRRIQRDRGEPYSQATAKLATEKWRSMSRSEKKPYENPEMKPTRIIPVRSKMSSKEGQWMSRMKQHKLLS